MPPDIGVFWRVLLFGAMKPPVSTNLAFGDPHPHRPGYIFTQYVQGLPNWRSPTAQASQLIRNAIWRAKSLDTEVGQARALITNARARCRRSGLFLDESPEFLNHVVDLIRGAKGYCPVLRRRFHRGTRLSMTLDRVLNELGYIIGNVCVISRSANAAKNCYSDGYSRMVCARSARRGLSRAGQLAVAVYMVTARARALAYFAKTLPAQIQGWWNR